MTLLTVPQVAKRVQLDETTVRRAIRRGELEATKLCSQIRISEQALNDWIDGNRITPAVDTARAPTPRAPRTAFSSGAQSRSFRDKVRKERRAA